jgi:hypothetical protein
VERLAQRAVEVQDHAVDAAAERVHGRHRAGELVPDLVDRRVRQPYRHQRPGGLSLPSPDRQQRDGLPRVVADEIGNGADDVRVGGDA